MKVDLYQRRGLYGLGEGEPGVLDLLSNIGSGLSAPVFGGISVSTIALFGIGAWVLLSLIGRGTARAYRTVAAPIRKRRKKTARLSEAKRRYEEERRGILG